MKKYLAFIVAAVLGLFCLTFVPGIHGQGTAHAVIPQVITREEAAKKYPPETGKDYPLGTSLPTSTGGFFRSPYSSQVYDGRKIKFKNSLILDTTVNKVFKSP